MSETSQTGDTVTNAQGCREIATAPKDWTDVILYEPGDGEIGQGYFDPEDGGDNKWHLLKFGQIVEPSHWMPLPLHPIPAPDSITIPQAEYKRLVEALERIGGLAESYHSMCHGPSFKRECDEICRCLPQVRAALKAAREGGKA